MQDLAKRNLIIVAGKGGVGKTTTSSAIALGLAAAGRQTLLVTVDPAKRLKDALGMDVGHTETPIQPNLHAMMLDPELVIRDHLSRYVTETDVASHPLFRYVTNYLPGLNELMAIGKLNDLRDEGRFECIVIDTAPTGHALSFLWAPKAIQELMGERSLLKWAIRGYTVWQKVSATAKGMGNLLKKKDDREAPPPDIDFERIFDGMREEATKIRAFLTDPEAACMVLVTLPEKLPVQETKELYDKVTEELDMSVSHIVVNKMQPDTLGPHADAFDAIEDDAAQRQRFVATTAKAGKVAPGLVEAMLEAARFGEVRRAMNMEHLALLHEVLPGVPTVQVPLFRRDVNGIKHLKRFQEALVQEPPSLQASA